MRIKKQKALKKCVIKIKLKFEDYKICVEATQLENKINQLEKKLKSQQRFRSKKHDIFTEEVNKILLSASGNKRIQSISSMETHAYGMSKDFALIWVGFFGVRFEMRGRRK